MSLGISIWLRMPCRDDLDKIEDSTDDENNAEEFLDLRCGGVSIFSTHTFEETEADSIDHGRNLLELVTLYNCSSAMSLYS